MTSRSQTPSLADEVFESRAWARDAFSDDGTRLPISFVVGDEVIHGIPPTWDPRSEERRIAATITETVFTGADPATGLRLRVERTVYHDAPVVEWIAWFHNDGATTSPPIRDILAMDVVLEGGDPRVVHTNGDFDSADGYTPTEDPLPTGRTLAFAPRGGRASDSAFPYHRILFDGGGVTLAVGWPAQWSATFSGVPAGVHVQAGQETTNLRLDPGERIRTPRMTAMFWRGDAARSINLWRRWYLVHILPRPAGGPLRPLLACAATDEGEEFTAATEENQLRYMDCTETKGSTSTSGGSMPGGTPARMRMACGAGVSRADGNRIPNDFPRGLKPVSDRATEHGADLLLWFEPERVWPGTEVDRRHPEWVLKIPENTATPWQQWWSSQGLLYLGDPECRRWLTDRLCQVIADNGIKVYRQDHNFGPLDHWRMHDAADRQGMTENLHVQGYLQLWDDLLARNPGLWIDSCAGGGRRNDLETMRRSVPLHYSDFGYGDNPVKLAFHHTLHAWIPYFKDVALAWDLADAGRFDQHIDSYAYHCGLAPMLALSIDIRRDDVDFALVHRMIDLWRRASDSMLFGDYHPLTPFGRSDDAWCVRQFDRPEFGRGFVQGIRLPRCPEETITVQLAAIDPDVTYLFENGETTEKRRIAGRDVIDQGFTFALAPRSGEIWFYRRLDDGAFEPSPA